MSSQAMVSLFQDVKNILLGVEDMLRRRRRSGRRSRVIVSLLLELRKILVRLALLSSRRRSSRRRVGGLGRGVEGGRGPPQAQGPVVRPFRVVSVVGLETSV